MSALEPLLYEWRDRPSITRHSHKEQIEGIEALVAAINEALPCDGGCNVNSGPEETCSRHGRPLAQVWAMQQDSQRRTLDAIDRLNASSIPQGMTEAMFNAATIIDVRRILTAPASPDIERKS